MSDNLEEMLETQRKFNEGLASDFRYMAVPNVNWVLRFIEAADSELGEVKDELPWKWWKTPQAVDWEKAKTEAMDTASFWLNICLAMGMTSDEIRSRHAAKMELSWQKREDYDGTALADR